MGLVHGAVAYYYRVIIDDNGESHSTVYKIFPQLCGYWAHFVSFNAISFHEQDKK